MPCVCVPLQHGGFLPAVKQLANVAALPGIVKVRQQLSCTRVQQQQQWIPPQPCCLATQQLCLSAAAGLLQRLGRLPWDVCASAAACCCYCLL